MERFLAARGGQRADAGPRQRVQPERDHLRAAARNPANTARVRIFTRTAELPFAGHPNVGTGYVLAQMGRDTDGVLLFEELAGLVEVRVARDDHGAVTGATIAAPQPLSLGLELPVEAVAACAGLQPDDIVTTAHWPIQASVGNPFAIAEVTDDALTRATPQIDAFRRALAQFPALGTGLALYVYARGPGSDIRARMFADWRHLRRPGDGQRRDAARRAAALARRRGGGPLRHRARGRDAPSQPAAHHGAAHARRHPRLGRRRLHPGAARRGGCVAEEAQFCHPIVDTSARSYAKYGIQHTRRGPAQNY